MATLAAPYSPRRPTETVLYNVVRENLATFSRWARETYDKPLPRYVEKELRAYLKCGVFAHGFVRVHCDGCGHDLLVAFSCKGRGLCPSCGGRRMANTAAHLVDRVLPNVPVRQWVLSLPYELRRLAAFDPRVLSAIGRLFVEAVFAHYRATFDDGQCGAITFVQRFGGSLNLNVHFHVLLLDGVMTRRGEAVTFHAAPAPTAMELDAIVRRTSQRAVRWLERHGHLDAREDVEDGDALGACAAAAMQRGLFAELPQTDDDKPPQELLGSRAAAEHMGFNLHAGVRIAAEDDVGRERLCRYGARPPLALGRFRRLRDGKVAYRTKYARKGKAQHRIMTPLELMARISALIPPPRYPLVRYHGVLAPSSPWRKLVVPQPPAMEKPCERNEPPPKPPAQERPARPTPPGPRVQATILAPNVLSIEHWRRLGGGALRAASPRIDWPQLLRRTFDIDVLECPTCKGRLKILAVVTDAEAIRTMLARLQITPPPSPSRARDPTTLLYADAVD